MKNIHFTVDLKGGVTPGDSDSVFAFENMETQIVAEFPEDFLGYEKFICFKFGKQFVTPEGVITDQIRVPFSSPFVIPYYLIDAVIEEVSFYLLSGSGNVFTTEAMEFPRLVRNASCHVGTGDPVPFGTDLLGGSNVEITKNATGLLTTYTVSLKAAPDSPLPISYIDGLTNALSGKVDKAEGKGLSSNDYTDEDKTAILHLEDNKLGKIRGKNLFDKSSQNILTGKLLQNGDVNVSSSDAVNYYITDFIPIKPTTNYVINDIYPDYSTYIVFYDQYKNVIDGAGITCFSVKDGSKPIYTPWASRYIRITGRQSFRDSMQFEEGIAKTSYECYTEYSPLQKLSDAAVKVTEQSLTDAQKVQARTNIGAADSITVSGIQNTVSGLGTALSGKVDKAEGFGLSSNDYTDEDKTAILHLEDNKLGKIRGKNLFDKLSQNIVFGKLLQNGDVDVRSSDAMNYYITDFIPVKPTTNYVINDLYPDNSTNIVFYDQYKDVIDGASITCFSVQDGSKPIYTPWASRYIRITGRQSFRDSMQFEEGTAKTTYEAYTDYAPLTVLSDTVSGLQSKVNDIINVSSWSDVQRIVREGKASSYFTVGDKFTCMHDIYGSIVFDVIGIDQDTPVNMAYGGHSLSLQAHKIVTSVPIDAVEALYYCETALPAGTYSFKILTNPGTSIDANKTFNFTLSSEAPAGSQLCAEGTYGSAVTTRKINVYADASSTTVLQTANISEGEVGTFLGVADGTFPNLNFFTKACSGNGAWKDTAMRQWLNSPGGSSQWWQPKSVFDRKPSYASSDGFLKWLDPELVAIMGDVVKIAGNGVTVNDKVFLPSQTELFFSGSNGYNEGSAYQYYKKYSSNPIATYINTDENCRIKFSGISIASWATRSPDITVGREGFVKTITNTGNSSLGASITSVGIAPVLCIV